MKKILKRTLSVIMVVLMILTSAPLGGFVDMDFSSITANAATISLNRPLDKEYPITGKEYYMGGIYHGALDYGVPKNTPVYAAEDGIINVYDGGYGDGYYGCPDGDGFGNYAIISHYDGWVTYYAHMLAGTFVVKTGDSVKRGQLIGYSGNSGSSTGPHLHFQLKQNNSTVYVEPYIKTASGYFSSTASTENNELIKEFYPSHCTIKVTEKDKDVMSLPCSNKSDSKSDKVEDATKGATYEAIGLVQNKWDKLWYKVKAKNGKVGYIFAGNVSSEVSIITSDIVGSGISVPENHTQGKPYNLTGSVNFPYKTVTDVSVYVYLGTKTSGTAKTGVSVPVSETSIALSNKSIDNKVEFNILTGGQQHTYVVTAKYKIYYAESDKKVGEKTGSVPIYKKTFNVVSHTCNKATFMYYWAEHPHYNCYKCSICNEIWASDETVFLPECTSCTNYIYPTNGGIYKIASGVGNNMYLDFACSSENVQIYENCDGHSNPDFVKSQYFKLTHVGDGWYTIINPANGKCVDIVATNPASGTNIIQWKCYPNDGQLYRFYDAGNGYCYIKSKLGTYVDVQNADNVNNTNVWAYSFNGSNAQKWKLQSHSHSYSSKVTTQPTHLKEGVRTYTCNGCLATYTESIAKTSTHTYSTAVTAPTCTAEGYTKYTCACGSSYKSNYVSKLDHTYSNSCDTSCNRCGATRSIAHNYAAATCTTAAKCTVCGATSGSALGHKYTNNCDTICNVCSAKRSITHSYSEATCTTPAKCTVCDVISGNALGHTYTNDCDESCNVCDEARTITHNYVLEATTNTYICSVCGDSYTEKVEVGFNNSENAKLNDNLLHMIPGVTVNELLSSASAGTYIKDTNGEKIADTVLPGTGMTLVLPDNSECTIIAYGDVDGDGAVKASDARSALRAAVGLDVLTESSKIAADLAETSAEKKITSADARFILRAAVGLESIKDWFSAL